MEKEYTTEQMTALTTIRSIMEQNGLSADDLPETQSLKTRLENLGNSYNEARDDKRDLLFKIVPAFYNEMVDNSSEDEAYEWVEENIFNRFGDKWRDLFADAGIKKKRFKIVEVEMKFSVVMPDDEYEGDWIDYVDTDYLDWSDADTYVEADDLSINEAEGYGTVNSVDDLR